MKLERTIQDNTLVLSEGDNKVLSIREVQNENTFEIYLDGSVRSDTVHELQDELSALAVMGFYLRVDLEKVSYLAASGVKIFADIQMMADKSGKGSLTLCRVPEAIMKQLDSMSMTWLLDIE